MKFQITGGNADAVITVKQRDVRNGLLFLDVKMSLPSLQSPEMFRVAFSISAIDIYSVWSPTIKFDRYLGPDWRMQTTKSRLASGLPIHALVSSKGQNRMTVALSDAKTPLSIRTGVCEETASVVCVIQFFTATVAPLKEYNATVRIDMRDIPYYDSIYDTTLWWEHDCGYRQAYIPEAAKLPVNSLWYSYHQQLDTEDIIKECRLSKAIGMDTVIVDDGWQTDDNNRGYQFCGDWNVAPQKIPDMKEFVSRVHGTGMKIMLWFSVPYIGLHSKAYQTFQDMLLDETGDNKTHWAIDPRYPEVRAYLISHYIRAVGEWGFDGLKLDFIDSFRLNEKSSEPDERRDYTALEDAVEKLIADTVQALRAINPDVLIEFRQSYVGPAIRQYGNMLRVTDCPNDPIRNREGTVTLRMCSGSSAIHSDMLMWHPQDTVESVGLQLISVLYSVPQISVKLQTLPENHKKMLQYFLNFWRENRDILLNGKLTADHPESAYSTVCAEKDAKAVLTCYTDTTVHCAPYRQAVVFNATASDTLILKGASGKSYTVRNCMGDMLEAGVLQSALCEIHVPTAGTVSVGS